MGLRKTVEAGGADQPRVQTDASAVGAFEMSRRDGLEAGRKTLLAEADALRRAADRLDGSFGEAVNLLLRHRGKVVVSALGKSGHVGKKIAATLCSTGTPTVFLHAAEAAHGDLGMISPRDPVILISKSGSTGELVRLVPRLREFESKLIGILGNLDSALARAVDVVLDARVDREADSLNLAPTNSSAVALGLGDALAVALMRARRFSDRDFARFHPAGQLGRNLSLKVSDVMHSEQRVAWLTTSTRLRDVVIEMTEHPLGAACVVDSGRHLLGIITDGDLRRALREHERFDTLRAEDVMTGDPVIVTPEASLQEAVRLMEERSSQISALPVVDRDSGRCVGVIRIHDIYQSERD